MKLRYLVNTFWKKGLIMGIFIGLLLFLVPLFLGSESKNVPELMWLLSGTPVCTLFGATRAEDCAFTFLLYGSFTLVILYGMIGAGIGFALDKFSKK